MAQSDVVFGRKFGQRTGYVKADTTLYDAGRAEEDLEYIEKHPTEVNSALAIVQRVKAELSVEVAAILEDPRLRCRLSSRTVHFVDLCRELENSTVAKWRSHVTYFSALAVEVEYRIECAQRFKVETRR